MKIVCLGFPNRGKSVGGSYICSLLPQPEMIRVNACPEPDSPWFQELSRKDPILAKKLRTKGSFTREFVDWAVQSVRRANNRIVWVDVGGRISRENRRICSQADAAVIFAADAEEARQWVTFAKSLQLRVLAVLFSSLDTSRQEYFQEALGQDWEFEGQVTGLVRGVFESSACLQALVNMLLETIPAIARADRNVLDIRDVAKLIAKPEAEVQAGRWFGPELARIQAALQPFTLLECEWVISGYAKQFLAAGIAVALQPRQVYLTDPKVAAGRVALS